MRKSLLCAAISPPDLVLSSLMMIRAAASTSYQIHEALAAPCHSKLPCAGSMQQAIHPQNLCSSICAYIHICASISPTCILLCNFSLSLSFSNLFLSLCFLLCLPQFVQISITLASWKFSLANSSLNLRRIEFSSKSLSLSHSLRVFSITNSST